MNANTENSLSDLEKSRSVLDSAIAAVPATLRERKPSPEVWSVAEVVEHVAIIDRRIAHLWKTKMAAAPATDEPTLLTPPDVSRLLDRSVRIDALRQVRPTGKLDFTSAYTELSEARTSLRDLIAQSDGIDLAGAVHPHPSFGPMNLYQWMSFIAAHEERHAAQIRDLAAVRW